MTPQDLPERIAEKIEETGDHWLWAAALNADGYGTVAWLREKRLAHRVVYELLVGPIPAGLELDHLCEHRHCVRPLHHEPVTHAENLRRRKPRSEWKPRTPRPAQENHDYGTGILAAPQPAPPKVQPAREGTPTTTLVLGAKGGTHCSTVAAALALHHAKTGGCRLIDATGTGDLAALCGLATSPPDHEPVEVKSGLWLINSRVPALDIGDQYPSIIDGGVLHETRTDQLLELGPLVLVTFAGPDYLQLRRYIGQPIAGAMAWLTMVGGSSLGRREIQDCTGLDIAATLLDSTSIARTIDAGTLCARVPATLADAAANATHNLTKENSR